MVRAGDGKGGGGRAVAAGRIRRQAFAATAGSGEGGEDGVKYRCLLKSREIDLLGLVETARTRSTESRPATPTWLHKLGGWRAINQPRTQLVSSLEPNLADYVLLSTM